MVKIYMLKDPDTLEIRYIGKTKQPLRRRWFGHITHSRLTRTSHVSCWIYSLTQLGKKPLIELIEECEENVWTEREQYWIAFYKEQLTNHSIGGEAGSLGYVCTDEHKKKISNALKGRKRTQEERDNISVGRTGIKLSDITKDKIRNVNLGKKYSLESRIKKSKYPVLQIDKFTKKIINEFPTLGIAQEITGCLKGNIVSACNGRLKTYKGFIWRYKK